MSSGGSAHPAYPDRKLPAWRRPPRFRGARHDQVCAEARLAGGATMSASGTLGTESDVKPTGMFPWWLVLIEGVAAIIIGVLLLLAPQATLELVFQLFGLFWLVDGVLRLAGAFTDPVDRGLKVGVGAAGIFAGIIVVRHPAWLAATMTLMFAGLLGCAGVTIGALSLVQAFRGGGWGAAILGLISLLFGALLLFNPFLTGIAW